MVDAGGWRLSRTAERRFVSTYRVQDHLKRIACEGIQASFSAAGPFIYPRATRSLWPKIPRTKFKRRDITVESYEKDGDEHVERSNSLLELLFAIPK
jgi:hypothetical protein